MEFQDRRASNDVNKGIPKTWKDNAALINGLWPTVSWTDEEKRLWHDELSKTNQDWVHRALQKVAKKYSASKPTLKWVLAEIRAIKYENESVNRSNLKELADEKERELEILRVQVEKERQDMIGLLQDLPQPMVEEATKNVRNVVGLDIDMDQDISEWSSLALGCTVVALERMATQSERNRNDG